MVLPHLAIQGLSLLKFKGQSAPPYDDLSFSFSHRQNEISYPYLNGSAHNWTGLNPFPLSVRMYFLNTLQVGAFPGMWNAWWDILKDGTPGDLEHPIAGNVEAVVLGGDIQVTAQVTAGLIATINFTDTITDPENLVTTEKLAVDIEYAAAQADAAAQAINVEPPSQASVTTLEQLAGIIRGMLEYGTLVQAYVDRAKSWVDTMIQLSEESQEHIKYDAIEKLTIFYNALTDTSEKLAESQRKTGIIIIDTDITLDIFAKQRGNTLQEIMGLNTGSLISPSVPKGTGLRYYV